MGAIDRSNGGVLGVDNASKSELVTNFPSSGTFTARASTTAVDVLVVAGGGGGGGGSSGSGTHGGGGGAGGLVLTTGLCYVWRFFCYSYNRCWWRSRFYW